MAGDRRVLFEGEHVALGLRRHSYTLFGPALILLLSCGLGSFLVATVPESGARTGLRLIIAAGALGVALRWALWPFALWYANCFLVTTYRLIRREGLRGGGTEVVLGRVRDVSVSRSVLQRIFGAGRLTIKVSEGSSPDGRVALVLDHVPMVLEVQRVLVALVDAVPRIAVLPTAPPPPSDPALPDLY